MTSVKITNRFTGAVLFEADLGAVYDSAAHSVRLGAAAKIALKAGADLECANLADANLAGANLAGANLAAADLTDADLTRANLADAYLTDANLEGACLTGAYLTGASLADANLSRANLEGANLARAKWKDGVTLSRAPIIISGATYAITILDRHMIIGCKCHALAEWDSFTPEQIAAMDGNRATEFWNTWKAPLMAMARADGRSFEEAAE